MSKSKKNQKIIFLVLKLLLSSGVVWVLYNQLKDFDQKAWETFDLKRPLSLIVAILLVYPNIWLSYAKWTLTLRVIGVESSLRTRVDSFLAGTVTGMLTPNMIGNFIGRFYYFDRSHRGEIVLLTMMANFGQFLASITFGWFAIFFAGEVFGIPGYDWMLTLAGIWMTFSFILFFVIERILGWLKKKSYIHRFIKTLKAFPMFRWKITAYSFSRFFVFTVQFALVLHAFGETINLQAFLGIWQVYLITMIVPSLVLGKLGVKEAIAIPLLGAIGMNQYAILTSSLIIWFINSMSPALLGLIICKKPEKNA